jgi:hypothetical protein
VLEPACLHEAAAAAEPAREHDEKEKQALREKMQQQQEQQQQFSLQQDEREVLDRRGASIALLLIAFTRASDANEPGCDLIHFLGLRS